ncbi:MAG TPA: A/G-specific adenine glycosylase [Steroidobacteraceae bacterium]|nr:A/G-specific adenine glycosylase [Steroidobacteraceae bacterium]
MTPQPQTIARKLLPWFRRHGRHDLPWQRNPTPYRVWISEVMLQQTQVATVIPYYERFLRRFPDAKSLAAARQDEVLGLWAGLGYYARARNLHRAAREIVARHGGTLPRTLEGLMALPGIGRSTAGAIMALAHGARHPILDGNAKRVLARLFLVREPPDTAGAALWALAEQCTPATRVAEYTQAIMDLGATLCTRARPACDRCPLREECGARAAGLVDELPARRQRRPRIIKRTHMVYVQKGGRVLLRRRAAKGIWGGLWAPPEFADAREARLWCKGFIADAVPRRLPVLRHSFTHFDLDISPWVLEIPRGGSVRAGQGERWLTPGVDARLGLPAPVARLLAAGLSNGDGAKESANGQDGEMRVARARGGRPRSRAVPRGAGPAHL